MLVSPYPLHLRWSDLHGCDFFTASHRRRRRRSPRLEALEPARELLAVNIVDFPLAQSATNLGAIASAPDGTLWYIDGKSIDRYDPTSGKITQHVPIGTPGSLTAGPDGNIWFTDVGAEGNEVGKLNPSTGAIVEYPITTTTGSLSITSGPDGAVWFSGSNGIGKVDPATGAITYYPLSIATPGGSSTVQADSLAAGPDGNLWFTDYDLTAIGKFNPSTGAVNEYPIPAYNDQSQWPPIPFQTDKPFEITAGPDQSLWFKLGKTHLGRISTAGSFTLYSTPSSTSWLGSLTLGADGNIWLTELGGNEVGKLDPSSGWFTEYPLPVAGMNDYGITTAPDGNLWFTETTINPSIPHSNRIGEIIPNSPTAGTITRLSSTANPSTFGLATTFTAGIGAIGDSNTLSGTVTFVIDGQPQKPVPVQGSTGAGFATLSTSSIAPGTHVVQAFYSGDPIHSASTSATVTQRVNSVSSRPPTFQTDNHAANASLPGQVGAVTLGFDGKIWFTDPMAGMVGRIDPITQSVTDFFIAIGGQNQVLVPSLGSIAEGPAGNLWFADDGNNEVGQLDPQTGMRSDYPLPSTKSSAIDLTASALGPVWFLDSGLQKIGAIDPGTGAITEYSSPVPFQQRASLPSLPDPMATLWFAESGTNKVARFSPAPQAGSPEYSFPGAASGQAGTLVEWSSDGLLWFTDSKTNQIGSIINPGRPGPVAGNIPFPRAHWLPAR